LKLEDIGGEQPVCEICSDELTNEEKKIAEKTHTLQCSFCKSYINLAGDLARNKFFIEKKLASNFKRFTTDPHSYRDVIDHFGFQFDFSEKRKEGEVNYLINSTNFLTDSEIFDGFKFFPQYAPQRSDRSIKTLEDFSEVKKGLDTWGVFRADVDHLGKIFKEGLGENQTITTISMLSYFVSLFFSAHVEHVAREYFNENIYIIYSGGDDMFALGTWSVLPDYARQIQQDFIRFTGYNPSITISGGIYISPSKKFPVYQAADSAGNSLELAKNDGRDRLTFLERPIPWKKFDDVKNITDQIVKLLEGDEGKKKVPRSLLQILYSGWAEKERAEVEKKKTGFSIFKVWRLLYAFKRLRERYRSNEQEINDLEINIMTDHKLKPYLDVATRWAEYLTR